MTRKEEQKGAKNHQTNPKKTKIRAPSHLEGISLGRAPWIGLHEMSETNQERKMRRQKGARDHGRNQTDRQPRFGQEFGVVPCMSEPNERWGSPSLPRTVSIAIQSVATLSGRNANAYEMQ